MNEVIRSKLSEISGVLDLHIGDTDPDTWDAFDDRPMTDQEIQDEYPVFWACSELNMLLHGVS